MQIEHLAIYNHSHNIHFFLSTFDLRTIIAVPAQKIMGVQYSFAQILLTVARIIVSEHFTDITVEKILSPI